MYANTKLTMSGRCTMLLFAMAFFMSFAVSVSAQSIISPAQSHEQAGRSELILVDIRRISEWQETGIATSATLISMHEPGFFEKLDQAVDSDHSRTIALICAVGGRSTWMQAQLLGRGYTNILNVAEGMIGGRHGPGWIVRGLPTKNYTE